MSKVRPRWEWSLVPSTAANPHSKTKVLSMKLPFQKLALLLLFIAAPIGLMQLTNRAIEQPARLPLLSDSSNPGFVACEAVGKSLRCVVVPHQLAYQSVHDIVRREVDLGPIHGSLVDRGYDLTSSDGDKRVRMDESGGEGDVSFEEIFFAEDVLPRDKAVGNEVTGLIVAAERAIGSSWRKISPIVVTLPSDLRRLRADSDVVLTRIAWGDWHSQAVEHLAVRSERGHSAMRPTPTRSPAPQHDVSSLSAADSVPGLIVAAERAVASSWRRIQPTVIAIPMRLKMLRPSSGSLAQLGPTQIGSAHLVRWIDRRDTDVPLVESWD